jgi:hypothetical protein
MSTPALIAEHFGTDTAPVLVQSFVPRQGWQEHNRRQSLTWDAVRNLRRRGVTAVAVAIPSAPNQVADFTITELVKHADRPLFGGRVI